MYSAPTELSVFLLPLLASRLRGASQRQKKKVFSLCVLCASSEAGGELLNVSDLFNSIV